MSQPDGHIPIVVGVTGASGAAYARRLLVCICRAGVPVHLVVSPHGARLLHDELEVDTLSTARLLGREAAELTWLPYADIGASIASGSYPTRGMIVCPCSSNSLAAIAAGLADNLITRAAAVTLKETRRLVVVPREMPTSRIDLLNALRIVECGGTVCPASPAFYMKPASIDDLIDSVVGKLLDLFDIPHSLRTRWTPSAKPGDLPPT